MSDHPTGSSPADDGRSLFSTYLDGEATPDEARAVEALVDHDEDARGELDDLRAVRSLVRDLPPVDAPFGFYERMLLAGDPTAGRAATPDPDAVLPVGAAAVAGDATVVSVDAAGARPPGRIRSFPRVVAASLSAAAAVILILGITPVTDRVVPPVQAFAARHEQMAEPAAARGSGPGATGTTVGFGSGTTSAVGAAPATAADAMDFDPMSPPMLDELGAPYSAPATIEPARVTRMRGYETSSGIVHLVYVANSAVVSIFEQPGTVGWDGMPAGGRLIDVGDDKAWAGTWAGDQVVVVEHDAVVYTVIATAPAEVTMAIATTLQPADPSMLDRAQQSCRSFVDHMGLGG